MGMLVLRNKMLMKMGLREMNDADFAFCLPLDGAFGFSTKYHALHDPALLETPTHDFDYTDVINVEVRSIARHDQEGSLGDQPRQQIFISVLLRRKHCSRPWITILE